MELALYFRTLDDEQGLTSLWKQIGEPMVGTLHFRNGEVGRCRRESWPTKSYMQRRSTGTFRLIHRRLYARREMQSGGFEPRSIWSN
jgi:hypothetical protein